MADVLPNAGRKNEYVGQRLNQLRDGFGIYCYANKFFRYEGDWSKGKKHGQYLIVLFAIKGGGTKRFSIFGFFAAYSL